MVQRFDSNGAHFGEMEETPGGWEECWSDVIRPAMFGLPDPVLRVTKRDFD